MAWGKVATRLSRRYRVVRLQRRQHRLDLQSGAPWTIADEVGDVLAIAKLIGKPMVIVGHSSGGTVALEAMVTSPETFAGAVLYEPPTVIGSEALVRARAAIDAGKHGQALTVFLRDIVRIPAGVARLIGVKEAVRPSTRAYIPPQIADCEAVERLGHRLDAYAHIAVPVVLFGGDRSPVHFSDGLDALAHAIPHSERVVLHGKGHYANKSAPDQVAALIATLTDKVLH